MCTWNCFVQLAGGPKHRKTVSMPDSFYDDATDDAGGAMMTSQHDVTVSRSHSDSHKRVEGVLEEEQSPNRVSIRG